MEMYFAKIIVHTFTIIPQLQNQAGKWYLEYESRTGESMKSWKHTEKQNLLEETVETKLNIVSSPIIKLRYDKLKNRGWKHIPEMKESVSKLCRIHFSVTISIVPIEYRLQENTHTIKLHFKA